MKIFKWTIGTLAALAALVKLVGLTSFLIGGDYSRVPQPAGSWIFGNVAGIVIFAVIALLCFRPKKKT